MLGTEMTRLQNRLSDRTAKSAKLNPGLHADGGGLYLCVKPSGSRSWVFVWIRNSKRREKGLGAYPATTLADARKRASDCRQAVALGRDPIAEDRKASEPTFGGCADQLLDSMEKGWRNEKHRAQWRMTLEHYAAPIRDKRVSEVGIEDVLAILKPLWQSRPETASRLRGRIERVLDYAKAHGWRSGENPALWRGHLQNVLPARKKLTRGHHAAMPYREVPAFVQSLGDKNAMAARALMFLILTAARAGEVLGATWDEIDLEAGLWTVPGKRMKAGKEHRVPLSDRALAIVRDLNEARVSDYVFPGQKPGRPLSVMAFDMLMRRTTAAESTTHGFRSSFRDWAGDCTSFAREIAEGALAHKVGDSVELAYRRGDALEKRRALMQAWANYCSNAHDGQIVQLNLAR
jgi:integrase